MAVTSISTTFTRFAQGILPIPSAAPNNCRQHMQHVTNRVIATLSTTRVSERKNVIVLSETAATRFRSKILFFLYNIFNYTQAKLERDQQNKLIARNLLARLACKIEDFNKMQATQTEPYELASVDEEFRVVRSNTLCTSKICIQKVGDSGSIELSCTYKNNGTVETFAIRMTKQQYDNLLYNLRVYAVKDNNGSSMFFNTVGPNSDQVTQQRPATPVHEIAQHPVPGTPALLKESSSLERDTQERSSFLEGAHSVFNPEQAVLFRKERGCGFPHETKFMKQVYTMLTPTQIRKLRHYVSLPILQNNCDGQIAIVGYTETSHVPYLQFELLNGPISLIDYLTFPTPNSPFNIAELLSQLTDLLMVLYTCGISHNDLHMENLLVTLKDGKPSIIAIDIGNSKCERSFHDIDYMLFRQAVTGFETFRRNVVRGPNHPKQLKHYPFHALLKRLELPDAKTIEILKNCGQGLKSRLTAIKFSEHTKEFAAEQCRNAFSAFKTQLQNEVLKAITMRQSSTPQTCQQQAHNAITPASTRLVAATAAV